MEALKSLSYNDQFTIIAYDHGQYYWNDSLQSANRSNVNAALSWVQQLTAGGMTDIMTPLQQAVQVLYPSTGGPSATGIPYVFLLTDGAVDNERDIARVSLIDRLPCVGWAVYSANIVAGAPMAVCRCPTKCSLMLNPAVDSVANAGARLPCA